ncbi:UvrD-helicase domain-containing protein [Verrucomicrobiaceae bacterium R5-34]|uniref:DNA 3'-5' helicase n=1 Tax=Oceaniferula flava TaxID=2800421 RepID=A0AAE2SC29_9BACT|nr:UvrD-helicase domain-containing protein [Oceaniferula flavus]MBK1832100.1 UvrD-helicase domain-containing protein [Verrucomicrobiaceae bacterium R5-34]MBK1854184.1 UvrD-helicase domain-containing protein [Oceaniferula flavus]MBM1135490.1 UvrD-helicase domain-containing protein [Oceaniferula flavus]
MSFDLSSLNPAQAEAVNALDGPVLILAGAGTGKTRTVTCRISHMVDRGIPADQILAVTFTNKAASEMSERVGQMVNKAAGKEITVCTFHSLCVRILRTGIDRLGYKQNFTIYTGNDQTGLIKQIIIRKGGAQEKIEPGLVISLISKAKNAGIPFSEMDDPFVAEVAQAYANELRAQNAVDFDDLLLLAEQLLREFPDVRDICRKRWTRVTVDEFQDTNSLQMRLLQQLVGEPYHVCVVGDDDQSIYGWRGAEVANILQFEKFFPNPKIIRLEYNYRSSDSIIHTANSLIVHNVGRREKQLRSVKPGGEDIRIISMPGDAEEAEFIAHEITDLHRVEKIPLEDIAILFRTNSQCRHLEQGLREEEIPYRMIGAQSFYDKREVRDILAYLQVLANPSADIPLLRIMNSPPRGIGQAAAIILTDNSRLRGGSVWESMGVPPEDLSTRAKNSILEFTTLIMKYRERMTSGAENMGDVLLELMEETGYIEWVKRNSKNEKEMDMRRNSIDDVVQQLKDASKKGKTLQKFLDQSALARDREDDNDIEKQKGVTLITLHASKGLEYPIVYLVGLEEGILPHKRSIEEGTTDEERRLLYVGITRAQDRCTLTWCSVRMKWGQEHAGEASKFLMELDDKYVEHMDYDDIMGEEASEEDLANFFADMRGDS